MSNVSARPQSATLSEDQISALSEAQDRLMQASMAFNAFMCLLVGDHPNDVDLEQMYWLLQPIQIEINTSLDALRPLESVFNPHIEENHHAA